MAEHPSPTTIRAAQTLQAAGRVSLPGAPSRGSGLMRGLLAVMLGLLCLVAVGGVGAAVFAAAMGARVIVPMFAGLGAVLVLVALLFLLLRRARRRQTAYADAEHLPVEIDARGLTLRGVGPVPWHHFAPPRVESLVPRGTGASRSRAVMRLTDAGLATVNEHLAPDLRGRLGPAQGLGTVRIHRWIELPSTAGMNEAEMIQLLTEAQRTFLARPVEQPGPTGLPGSSRPQRQKTLAEAPGPPQSGPVGPPDRRLRPGIVAILVGAGVALLIPVAVLLAVLIGGGA